jgi:hypothetical protein
MVGIEKQIMQLYHFMYHIIHIPSVSGQITVVVKAVVVDPVV